MESRTSHEWLKNGTNGCSLQFLEITPRWHSALIERIQNLGLSLDFSDENMQISASVWNPQNTIKLVQQFQPMWFIDRTFLYIFHTILHYHLREEFSVCKANVGVHGLHSNTIAAFLAHFNFKYGIDLYLPLYKHPIFINYSDTNDECSLKKTNQT